jgi:hypothetical protein
VATSGSTDFAINRTQMIKAAMLKIGAIDAAQTPTGPDYDSVSQTLNMMLKAMQADGLKLWLRKKATLLLESNKSSYLLGPTGDHCTYSYTRTAIKVAASSTDTSIDVDDTTGALASDYIGFVLDDGTIQWTTIDTVVDGDTLTIPAPGLSGAAAVGNYVYFYRTKIDRPLRILQVVVRDSSANDRPVDIIGQDLYTDLATKTTTGRITQVHYDHQLTNGVLYVWPRSSVMTDTLELIVQRPWEDMDSATDDFDCPQEWYEPILYGLTYRICPDYGVPLQTKNSIGLDAQMFLDKAMGFDVENASLFLRPSVRR